MGFEGTAEAKDLVEMPVSALTVVSLIQPCLSYAMIVVCVSTFCKKALLLLDPVRFASLLL